MTSGGPRLVRGGLAEAALEGRVAADAYVEPVELQAIAPAAWILAAPTAGAERLGQLLFGERFETLGAEGDWTYGRSARDGCIGWAAPARLGAPSRPTHRVQSLRAFAYAEPDPRAAPFGPLALNALVSVSAGQGRHLQDAQAGWLIESDLTPIGQGFEGDPAAVALRFLGAPYLRGARDGVGLDAPGLVQQALHACGLACPRTLGEIAELGRAVEDASALRRGDLVVWADHVGIMLDGERLLSADPHAMAVVVEPLSVVAARLGEANASPPALRRP